MCVCVCVHAYSHTQVWFSFCDVFGFSRGIEPIKVFVGGGLVVKSCPSLASLWTVARQAPLSMGILQARILYWVAMPSSRGSS